MAWACEAWLRPIADMSLHHERFAKAMSKCQHAGGHCAEDGFCHFDSPRPAQRQGMGALRIASREAQRA